MPHTMADGLRKLGMPVRLERGVIVLPDNFELCQAGVAITPEQGRLLKLFGHQLAVFRLALAAVWSEKEGFRSLATDEAGAGGTAALEGRVTKTRKTAGSTGGGRGLRQAKKRDEEEDEDEEDEDEEDEEEEEDEDME
jgi:mRNA turnover protein 4